jgi:hypothetical protein
VNPVGLVTSLIQTVTMCTRCSAAELSTAFYIGSTSRIIAANTNNIVFKLTAVNANVSASNTTQSATIADSAVYWFQLTAAVPRHTPSNTRLNGLPFPVVIYTTTTNFPEDVIVTDTIQTINISTTKLSVSNTYPVFGKPTVNNYIGTSLFGVRLDIIMSEHVYFAVQSTTSALAHYQIKFDRVLVNVGNAWNRASSAFIAPSAGNYFLTFGCGAAALKRTDFIMQLNGKGVAAVGIFEEGQGQHNGVQMGRYSAMWALTANDVITFTPSSSVYSSADGLVNAQGMLYSPLGGAAVAVAWNVALTKNPRDARVCELGYGWSGSTSALPYDHVTVNLQHAWNNSTSKVTIPVAGIYFVDLSAYICASRNYNSPSE